MAPRKNATTAAAAAPAAAPVQETPAAAPVDIPVVEAEVEAAAPAPVVPQTTGEKFASVIETIAALTLILKDSLTKGKLALKELQGLQKEIGQLEKDKAKKNKGRAAKAAAASEAAEGGAAVVARRPSGFATPAFLSTQLSEFLGVPQGTKMARTDVTRLITDYVKKNQLHNTADKRIIIADDKLKQILGEVKADDKLTYFNLQTHIKHHFIKNPAAVEPAPVAV